jgi:hypothetical protein
MDCSLEWFHKFAAAISSEFGEGPALMLENVHNGIDRMAIFELFSERMVDQFHPRLVLIALQGGIEEYLKP